MNLRVGDRGIRSFGQNRIAHFKINGWQTIGILVTLVY